MKHFFFIFGMCPFDENNGSGQQLNGFQINMEPINFLMLNIAVADCLHVWLRVLQSPWFLPFICSST